MHTYTDTHIYKTFDNKKNHFYFQSPNDLMLNGSPRMTLPFLREFKYLLLRLVKGGGHRPDGLSLSLIPGRSHSLLCDSDRPLWPSFLTENEAPRFCLDEWDLKQKLSGCHSDSWSRKSMHHLKTELSCVSIKKKKKKTL